MLSQDYILTTKMMDPTPADCDQNRCRICNGQKRPLIKLCQCSGSIAFVHEECILDWITKKMEQSVNVQIPCCEICQAQYSARMKLGRKKVCYKTFLKRVTELGYKCHWASTFYLMGSLASLFYLVRVMICVVMTLAGVEMGLGYQAILSNVLETFFLMVVLPVYFILKALKHGKKRMKLLSESMIQLVELTLMPKVIIKT